MTPPTDNYARAIRAAAPVDLVLVALEISHPAIPAPARIVNDTVNRVIDGETFVGLRFGAGLAADVEGRAPTATITVDNVGREMMQWIERAQAAPGGIPGTSIRILKVRAFTAAEDAAAVTAGRAPEPPGAHDPEWEITMDVNNITATTRQIEIGLGFDPLLGRAAVSLRHDPQISPGLF